MGGEFYKKEDLEEDLLLTIAGIERAEFPNKDQTKETKLVLTFAGEGTKKFSLGKTNLKVLVKAYGKHTVGWIGKPVVLYVDENVTFAGNLVGGMRLRIPKARSQERPVPVPGDTFISDTEAPPF